MTSPQTAEPSRRWQALTALAMLLAVVGVASLAFLVIARLAGEATWNGLNWVSFSALPLAFVLLMILVVRAVWRRRRL